MTKAELIAYNHGQWLARRAIELRTEGKTWRDVGAPNLSDEVVESLRVLGGSLWQAWVERGGLAVFAAADSAT